MVRIYYVPDYYIYYLLWFLFNMSLIDYDSYLICPWLTMTII